MNFFKKESWSPYLAGGLTGIVLVLGVLLVDGWFGSTTTFARVGSLFIQGTKISESTFFTVNNYLFSYQTLFNYQTFFVVGILVGAFVSAKMSNTFEVTHVPNRFKQRFGENRPLRYTMAFTGGMIMVIGARIADGCASWWGISASSKLSAAGLATLIFFFIGAVVTNYFIFGKEYFGKRGK